MKPTDSQHEFIEKVGLWWETVGSRSAGRILGWLMVCDPPHRSAAQLVEELQLSSGSVSTQTTTLERVGFVDRVSFPGDRATYYQLKPHVWIDVMRTEEQRIDEMLRLARAGAQVRPNTRPDRVDDLATVAQFFVDKWPSLMEELLEYLEKEKTS